MQKTQASSLRRYQEKELRAFAHQQRIWKQYCESKKKIDSKFDECLRIKQESNDIRQELKRARKSLQRLSSGSNESKRKEIAQIIERYNEKEEQFQRADQELISLTQERDKLREDYLGAKQAYEAIMKDAP